MSTRFLDAAPAEAVGPADRLTPIRKPAGFVPAVQRWSFVLPDNEPGLRVAFFGAQAPSAPALADHPLHGWIREHLAGHKAGPTCLDHARIHDVSGRVDHVVCAYWVSEARFAAWEADETAEAWWQAPARLEGDAGAWREILRVPRGRQESIYWQDYPAGLMASPDVRIFPTPYCGYYGAMRDRLPDAALPPAPRRRRMSALVLPLVSRTRPVAPTIAAPAVSASVLSAPAVTWRLVLGAGALGADVVATAVAGPARAAP